MDLYAELILDHAKAPHHAGLRAPYDIEVRQVNPVCGDEVTLRLRLDGEGPEAVVEDVSYDAQGCAISKASTSVLTDLVLGRPVTHAVGVGAAVRDMVRTRDGSAPDEDLLGDAVALQGVAKYPARVKCALLGWSALSEALLLTGALATSPQPPESLPLKENAS
ncbi:MAG: Fe-S cluster assembly sulfur transfer protein SufU [Actinomycetales bacterium]